jgi:tRNA(fMet)-specific endonuclease VapC
MGQIIGSNDLLIASIVVAQKGILITHNTAEFKRISGLIVTDWVL